MPHSRTHGSLSVWRSILASMLAPLIALPAAADECTDLASLARTFAPKGARMSDRVALREMVYVVGSAAGKAFGLWSEISIRTIALVLADVSDAEAEARALRIWRAVEKLGGEDRKKLRKAAEALLRQEKEEKRSAAKAASRAKKKAPYRRRGPRA